MYTHVCNLLAAAVLCGASLPALGQDLSGRWLLELQNTKRETVATLHVLLTSRAATSCLGISDAQWRRVVVQSRSAGTDRFFPAAHPLAFTVRGSELTMGRVEYCDAYRLLRGTLEGHTAAGRYFAYGLEGETPLGFFKLVKQR